MRVQKDCDLYPYNTMKLRSVADVVYFPENREELDNLVIKFKSEAVSFAVFSAGSNVIFSERVKTPLINLMSVDSSIEHLPDGRVKAGCSVRVQALIKDLQAHGLGGIEYLYSVPSSIGGAVYMNAGRGKTIGLSISDYLEEVEYFSLADNKIRIYKKNPVDFSHRHSPFQNMESIVISAIFRFPEQNPDVTEQKIKDRMEYSKKYLSADKPSCGSVFCEGNRFVYRLLMGKKVGGAMYSKKTPDWISNIGNATASDVKALVEKGKKFHKLFFSNCKSEIRFIS